MLSTKWFLAAVVGAALCEPKVQVLHLQEATSAWARVLDDINSSSVIQDSVANLQTVYPDLEYAFATYADKNAPLQGIGNTWGMWKSYPGGIDKCYSRQKTLSSNVSSDLWNGQTFAGKDAEEGQWDALARATVDSGLGWDMAKTTADGQPVARIIVLFTDAFSHTATSADFIQNIGSPTNYRWLNDHYINNFGKYQADSDAGSIIQTDFAGIDDNWSAAPYDTPVPGRTSYNAYVMCNDRDAVEDSDKNTYSRDVNAKYPTFSATYDKDEWDDLCSHADVLFPWKGDFKYLDTSAIVDFPYSSLQADADCSLYEHPDPSSPAYAAMFEGFIPVVVALPEVPTNTEIYLGAANHCSPEFDANDLNNVMVDPNDEHKRKYHECFSRHYSNGLSSFPDRSSLLRVEDFAAKSADRVASLLREAIDEAVRTLVCDAPTEGASASTGTGGGEAENESDSVSVGAIVGGVFGAVGGAAIVGGLVYAAWLHSVFPCCGAAAAKRLSNDEEEKPDADV